jgi:hypothetical protein
MKLTVEQIDDILKTHKPSTLPIEKMRDKAFMIVGDATVVDGNRDAFALNSPAKLVTLDLHKQYVDRVLVRDTFSEEDVKRVQRLMIARAFEFVKSFEGQKVYANHYGFQMPGSRSYCRSLEDGLGSYELRYVIEFYIENA